MQQVPEVAAAEELEAAEVTVVVTAAVGAVAVVLELGCSLLLNT